MAYEINEQTKQQLNHIGEVVTGKTNGAPNGSDIATSTLPYTGQVRNTVPELLSKIGWYSAGAWSSNPLIETENQFVIDGGVRYVPLSFPYQVDSTTNPDPSVLLGAELKVITDVSDGELTQAQEELLPPSSQIYPESGALANGMTVPAGTTHLRVLVGGKPTIVVMSPLASGVVSNLTETGATIGATNVSFKRVSQVYYAEDMNDAISHAQSYRQVIVTSRGNAPFKQVDQVTYDSYPDLAKFTDNSGQLWGIATTNRVEIEWFYEEGETDHTPAWQTCFDLNARYIQAKPGFDYQWLTPQYTDVYGNKYWTTPKANFKIFGDDSTINTANLGNVNLSIMSSRFAPSPINVYEVENLIIRAANRSPGTDKIVRTCFDAFDVMKTKIVDCTWYGGDHSTLVGCDNNDPKARMDVIRPNVFNVLTIQIDPADTSFFYGHCANGSIKGGIAFQDGVDLAQFCEVHESNWEVSGNRAFGFRVFSFVDNGGYVSQYAQETSRIVFSNNIVSCMNAFVTPTDANQPFRPGGKVSNITIEGNQVHFIPTITGRSELPQGIFAPSDINGNGVETVENIEINNNLITFADFGAQITDCRYLSIQSKYARNISFKGNNVRGWNAAKINVEVLESLDWSNNKISLRYGDVSGIDSFSLDMRAVSMSNVDFEGNNWGIVEQTTNSQVMFIQFTTASSLSFKNDEIGYGTITSYFYMGVSYQQLLDSGVVLENIPLRYAGFNIPSVLNGDIGIAELNLFGDGAILDRQVDVGVSNILSGSFPSNARFLSKFRLGTASPILTAPVYACGGDIVATGLTALLNVSLNTKQ